MASKPRAPTARWERLLDLDPDLAETFDERTRARARDRVGVAAVHLPAGSWRPEDLTESARHAFALLVCDGLIVRELELAGTLTADLLGPGDVVPPGTSSEPLLAPGEHWHVGAHATVAILDDRLRPALHAWPALSSRLIARGARQAARAAEQRAISQLPRVDLRIRALLWHLAGRWGRMGTMGVVLPLELTHGALGRLVGARRPTVTIALGELARDGSVVRRSDGSWVLRADSRPEGGREIHAPSRVLARLGPGAERRRPTPAPAFELLAARLERIRVASADQRNRSAELLAVCEATRQRGLRSRALRAGAVGFADVLHEHDRAVDAVPVEGQGHGHDATREAVAASVRRVE
jgi:hypothetical protein